MIGGIDLVEIHHLPAENGRTFDEMDAAARSGQIQGGRYPGDAAAFHENGQAVDGPGRILKGPLHHVPILPLSTGRIVRPGT